jgi:hypothetical protein
MQVKFLNSIFVKRISVILDILIPFLLYISLNNHILLLSWLLLGILVFVRVLLVIISK